MKIRSRSRALALALFAVACGGRGAGSHPQDAEADAGGEIPESVIPAGPEAGADRGDANAEPVTGSHSFDVVARLTVKPTKFLVPPDAAPPPTNMFSLTLDAGRGWIMLGNEARSQAVPATTADGRTFRTTAPVYVPTPGAGCPNGIFAIQYDSIEVFVVDGRLRGTADGIVASLFGDVGYNVPFSAALEGEPDATVPFIVVEANATLPHPFATLTAWGSEPLAPTATARLVAMDGSQVDLVPQPGPGGVIIQTFITPRTVLHFGVGFELRSDGLVDLAGLKGAADSALRIGAVPTPPLVAEDGFESVTGDLVGEAAVVRGGVLSPIAGTTSVYVGAPAVAAPPGVSISKPLTVRIPRYASDTMVRFTYRLVGPFLPIAFRGSVYAGSVDHPFAEKGPTFPPADGTTLIPNTVNVGPIERMEIALPDSVEGELVVAIQPATVRCGGFADVNQVGMLVDDLRAE